MARSLQRLLVVGDTRRELLPGLLAVAGGVAAAAEDAVSRRSCAPVPRGVADAPVVTAEGFELDLAARGVRRDAAEVHLTPIAFSLLNVLAADHTEPGVDYRFAA